MFLSFANQKKNSSYRIGLISLTLIASLVLVNCGKEESGPAYQASGSDIQGQWVVDHDAMKEAAGFNPIDRAAIELLKETRFDITASTLTAQMTVLGEQAEFSGNYKVSSVAGNTIVMQATSGAQTGQEWRVVFKDRDHIQLTGKPGSGGGDEMDLYMMRTTQ